MDWRDVNSISIGEMENLLAENRQYLQPLGEIHMTLDTWNAIKVAAVSGTMMRYGVGILAGALVGAFAAYRWEIRR